MKKRKKMFYFLLFLIFIIVEIIIAVFIRDQFIRSYIGDMLIIIVLYCFIRMFTEKNYLLPLWIFFFAVIVEILQYFKLANLLLLEHNKLISIVIGSTFDLVDILWYAIGTILLFAVEYKKKEHSFRHFSA